MIKRTDAENEIYLREWNIVMNEESIEVVWMTIISGRKQKEALLVALSDAGGRLINTMYGKGSVEINYFKDIFGFAPENNKVVITCIIIRKRVPALLKTLAEKFDFEKPNTGIAFTTCVERLSF